MSDDEYLVRNRRVHNSPHHMINNWSARSSDISSDQDLEEPILVSSDDSDESDNDVAWEEDQSSETGLRVDQ